MSLWCLCSISIELAPPAGPRLLTKTIVGGFLANLYEGVGWDVVRINYLGDWGKQYGLLALAFERFGDEEALKKNPIAHLFDIYVKIVRPCLSFPMPYLGTEAGG